MFGGIAHLISRPGAQALQSALVATVPKRQGLLATIIAVVTLLVTTIGLFVELQDALNRVWGVVPRWLTFQDQIITKPTHARRTSARIDLSPFGFQKAEVLISRGRDKF